MFKGSDLRGTKLLDANLSKANLKGADLEEANLKGVNLREAYLFETHMQNTDLRGSKIVHTHLDRDIRSIYWPLPYLKWPQHPGMTFIFPGPSHAHFCLDYNTSVKQDLHFRFC